MMVRDRVEPVILLLLVHLKEVMVEMVKIQEIMPSEVVVEEQLKQAQVEQVDREVRVAMEQRHLLKVLLLLMLVAEEDQHRAQIIQHQNVASVASVEVAKEVQQEHQLLRVQLELPIRAAVAVLRLKKIMPLLQARVADLES
jgi:GTPase Era involved in 16S rRNA processing